MKIDNFWKVIKTKFTLLWMSQLLSQITNNLINFTLALIIFEKTSSTATISLIWFFYAIPTLLLAPFSGTIVDLVDKRKVLILTNLIQSFIVLLYLLIKIRVWVVYSLIFFYSLINQLYLPAEGATLPLLVPRPLYPIANAIFMFTANITFFLGFALAGPLVRVLGKESIFLLCAAFLFLAATSVYFLPKNLKKIKKRKINLFLFFKKVKEGYVYLTKNPLILFPLAIIVAAQIMVGIFAIIVPTYTREILKISLIDAGVILISPAGLGALTGAVLASQRLIKKVRKKVFISSGLGFSTFSFLILGLLIYLLPQKVKILFSTLFSFLLGMAFVFLIIPCQTLVQEKTSKEFYGRIYGVLGFLITLASILPILVIGAIVDFLGIRVILTLIGIITGIIWFISLKDTHEIIKIS